MSSNKKKDQAPMPASSAGLLQFFEDENTGVSVRPVVVIAVSVCLIAGALILNVFF